MRRQQHFSFVLSGRHCSCCQLLISNEREEGCFWMTLLCAGIRLAADWLLPLLALPLEWFASLARPGLLHR